MKVLWECPRCHHQRLRPEDPWIPWCSCIPSLVRMDEIGPRGDYPFRSLVSLEITMCVWP